MIEELLIALDGCPGDVFFSSTIQDLSNSHQEKEKPRWLVAPELISYLHPGERELLSKLLILSAYVVDFEKFIQTYGSLAFFRQVISSVEKKSIDRSDDSKSITANLRFSDSDMVNDLPLFGAYAASLAEGFSSILENYRSRLIDLEKSICDYEQSSIDCGEEFRRASNCLSRIYAELLPYFRIFPVLDIFVNSFSSNSSTKLRNGGEILSFICQIYESERGDFLVKTELELLLRRCLAPFRNQLMHFLANGRLDCDRFDEFFIQITSTTTDKDDDSFAVRKNYLPKFVGESVAEKILFIGKSVKLMSESSIELDDWENQLSPLSNLLRSFSSGDQQLKYEDLTSELETKIESIRRAAAEKLYSHCFEKTNARNVLESWVKDLFFIGKGELFLSFIDSAESILSQPISADQSISERQSILLANCWTTAMEKIYWQNDDEREYFDKVTPRFSSDQISEKKIDCVWTTIDLLLDVPQRLKPIFTSEFVTSLNRIFHFLLRWRRTQSLIESCWFNLKKSPSTITRSLPGLEKIHQLTSLMLFVVKNLQYYIQADVLETVYAQTIKELSTNRDFEHVLKLLHVDMIDRINSHCFLKRPDDRNIGKILKMFGDECDTFSTLVLSRLVSGSGDKSDDNESSSSVAEIDRLFAAQIHECYVNFQRKTALLFKILTTNKVHDSSACLSHLLLRLDFNNYFSNTQLFSA